MSYPRRQLGIAPAVVAAAIPLVENLFSSMGSGALTNRQLPSAAAGINGMFSTVLGDLPNIGDPSTAAGYNFARMRCLAGDMSEDAAFDATAAPYCGYAEQSSREYARAAVIIAASNALAAGVPVQASYTFHDVNAAGAGSKTLTAAASLANTPLPSVSSGNSAPGGTLYTPLPGGGTIGLPVNTSTITGAAIMGIPVLAWLAGGLVLAFAVGGGGRRR